MRFSGKKNQKTSKVGKIRKYDEKRALFREKKPFHLIKSLLYKNGKAQKMPVLASRLVNNTSKILCKIYIVYVKIIFVEEINFVWTCEGFKDFFCINTI